MKDRTSRQSTSKKNRWLLISAIAIFLVLISTLAAYSYINQINKKQVIYDSSTYFTISDLAGTYSTVGTLYNGSDPGPSVLVKELGFNWTPVGGDASNVRIFMQGMEDPTQTWWIGVTKNGTSTSTGEITLTNPILIQRQADGLFDLPIRIAADQANGTVVLQFNATKGGNFLWEGAQNPS